MKITRLYRVKAAGFFITFTVKKSLLKAQRWNIDKPAEHVVKMLDMDISDVWSAGK